MPLVMECENCGYRATGVQAALCPVCENILTPEMPPTDQEPWTFWDIVKVAVLLPFLPAMLLFMLAFSIVLLVLSPVLLLIARILPERAPRPPSTPKGTMRCKQCMYRLAGVKHNCPECGEPFDPDEPDTYDFVAEQDIRVVALCVIGCGMLALLMIVGIAALEGFEIEWDLTLMTTGVITAIFAVIFIVPAALSNRRIRRMD